MVAVFVQFTFFFSFEILLSDPWYYWWNIIFLTTKCLWSRHQTSITASNQLDCHYRSEINSFCGSPSAVHCENIYVQSVLIIIYYKPKLAHLLMQYLFLIEVHSIIKQQMYTFMYIIALKYISSHVDKSIGKLPAVAQMRHTTCRKHPVCPDRDTKRSDYSSSYSYSCSVSMEQKSGWLAHNQHYMM